MLKLILISVIFLYVIFKVSGFILRIFDTVLGRTPGGYARKSFNTQQARNKPKYRQPANGNVNIEYIPEEDKSPQGAKGFRGGEYVDYEEVKE